MSHSPFRSALGKTIVLSGLLVALLAVPAFADDVADVTKLMHAGQHVAALAKANAFLGKHPRDAQMRFLKGVILTEQNKSADAIAVFTKLTEDYPSLPEPYNNLAVLYAAAGQYDKARFALDAAIRTNPSYATAYENLGDVHAKLASQAYDKALQLDSSNPVAKSKLTLVRSLVGNMNAVSKPTAALPPVATKAPVVAKAAAPAKVKAPVVVKAAEPVAAPVAKQEAAKPAPKPVQKADAERDDVMDAVNSWAKAWSNRDMKEYLGHYSSDFDTPHGMSRKSWEGQRHDRIVNKSHINVKIESPRVAVSGNTATVKFRQIYVSDHFTADSHKTLVMEKHGGQWLIKRESTGS